MNTKKLKKGANNGVNESNNILTPKKTKKKKTELLNENTITEHKTRKRKIVDSEIETVAPKRSRKKKTGENNAELILPDDNIENVPSTKSFKQKNGHIVSELGADEMEVALDEMPKKGKKKKKQKTDLQPFTKNDLDLGVSTSKSSKGSRSSNLMNVEDIHNSLSDSSKIILHHEVNIVDIKDAKVDENNENIVTISIQEDGLESDWDENDLLKQLERRIEKKESPKERSVGIGWPESDLNELVDRMEVGLPENDLKIYLRRAEELEWDKIAFKNYTPDDCKKAWGLLVKKLRKHRILKEVLHDAREWISIPKIKKKTLRPPRHPDMPRRPLSAYLIYYMKKKDSVQAEHQGIDATELAKVVSQKYKLLPPEKKLKYEKIAAKNKEEYEQKIKAFHEAHPDYKIESKSKKTKPKEPSVPKPVVEKLAHKPPKPVKEKVPKRPLSAFLYYHLSESSKEEVQDKATFKELCKDRWKQMPDDKKIEYISYAEAETLKYEEELKEYIKNHPEYVHTSQSKPQLTKEEQLVKERLAGKPPKPPVSAYNLFARILLHSEDIKNIPIKDRLVFVANQWKECTDEEKKHYKDLFDQTIEKHNRDYASYLQSLSEEERKLEVEKNVAKRKKPEEDKAKKDKPKSKKVTVKKTEKTVTLPEKKKPVASKVDGTSKKTEKKGKKLVEPEQPPISAFKYFASFYNGEEPAVKVWKQLSAEEKKKYEDELVQKKKAYILDFEKFLKSMTKEELENFSNSRKKQNMQKIAEEEEEEGEETSDQSESEDSIGEDSSGEEKN